MSTQYIVEVHEQVPNLDEESKEYYNHFSYAQYEEEFALHPERFDTDWDGIVDSVEFAYDKDKWLGDLCVPTFNDAIHAVVQTIAYFATRKYNIWPMMGAEYGWHCESPEGGLITIELVEVQR